MTTVNIYLTFNGNCEEAFQFYSKAFDMPIPYMSRFSEMPDDSGHSKDSLDGNKIMHVSLPISTETVLMGSDTGGEWAADFRAGNNFSISIHVDSRNEADRLFAALSLNGKITMPMNDTFWGDYFGMFTDAFGVNWMISFPTGTKSN